MREAHTVVANREGRKGERQIEGSKRSGRVDKEVANT
jgi:hypothetical protein